MSRLMLIFFLMILMAACTTAPGLPTAAPETETVVVTNLPAVSPTPDIYEQNIHLFDYESESAVVVTENAVQQEEGYTVHDISYPSPKTGQVPAYLVIPEGAGPFAGMILMHGSSGSRETLLPLAKDLAHTGAIVLTISAPSARTTGRYWIHFTPQDRDEQIQLMVDLRRGVDLLIQHEKVDSTRLGYIGYSYGAAMGGLLAGIEPRIKAYGLMVGDGGLVNHFMDGETPVGGFDTVDPATRQIWLEAMQPIEPISYIGHSGSALFFQNAKYDSLVTEEDALAYQAAANEPKKIEWYESGHGLPTQAYLDMVAWLAEQIGIDATKFKLSN